jgi:hypothetical protein
MRSHYGLCEHNVWMRIGFFAMPLHLLLVVRLRGGSRSSGFGHATSSDVGAEMQTINRFGDRNDVETPAVAGVEKLACDSGGGFGPVLTHDRW